MLKPRVAILTVAVGALLALPSPAAATTPGQWMSQANAACGKPFAKDTKIFRKASRAFHNARTRGAYRHSGRLFIRSQRIELAGVSKVEAVGLTDDSDYNELIGRWIDLQRASAQYRMAFGRAIVGLKPFKKLVRLDKLAVKNGNAAARVGSGLGLTKC